MIFKYVFIDSRSPPRDGHFFFYLLQEVVFLGMLYAPPTVLSLLAEETNMCGRISRPVTKQRCNLFEESLKATVGGAGISRNLDGGLNQNRAFAHVIERVDGDDGDGDYGERERVAGN